MTTRMDNVAGIVLSAIFEATRRDETKVKMENTGMILIASFKTFFLLYLGF